MRQEYRASPATPRSAPSMAPNLRTKHRGLGRCTLRQRGCGMKHNALLQHAGIVGGSLVPSCNPSGCYNNQQHSKCWLGRLVSFIILLCCCFVWRRLDSHIRGLRIICSTSLPDFEIRSGEMRSGSAFSPDQKSKPTNLGLNWESEKSKNKNWGRCVHKL